MSGRGVAATVSRRPIGGGWSDLAVILSDGLGNLAFEDRQVSPGDRYLYRLGIVDAGELQYVGETLIEIPSPSFALLGARPNPVVDGRLAVSFSLALRALFPLPDTSIEYLPVELPHSTGKFSGGYALVPRRYTRFLYPDFVGGCLLN